MDIHCIYEKIEILRSELTKEYEKCIDKDGINPKVIELSQRLDKLIVDYIKMAAPNSNKYSSNNNNGGIA